MPADCTISFVVTSRNDNHGKNMIRRFRLFAEGLLQQASRHGLSGELIVVEWNPPPGPRLSELLDLKIPSDIFAVRFIEVPREAHRVIRNSDVIPLFQMIAKNVGIRRARGDFVVATNPDLLFSDALVSFFASGRLRHDVMYRIDRHDVPADPPENASIDDLVDSWCVANVLRVHKRWGSFPPISQWKVMVRHLSAASATGIVLPTSNLGPAGHATLRRFGAPARLWRRLSYWALYLIRTTLSTGAKYLDPLPKIHTNGCGDFTMLSRKAWFELQGYPELPLWSMHLDSLLCYMAVASGIREQVLEAPKRMFHLEHENSWVVMTPDARLRTFANKPWLDFDLLTEIWHNMYYKGQAVKFNDENWGLADWSLDEILITRTEKELIKSRVSSLAARGP
jgi:hypothetical protein